VAYITGRSYFFGLELSVGPGVLVPRPETELLVEWALGRLPRADRQPRFVDVGTGSGAIALAVAQARPDVIVHATDTKGVALRQAHDNAMRLGLADRVRLHEVDLLPPDDTVFDVIVANLPYVAVDDPDLAPEVGAFEPHEALFGGIDGLTAIRRLALVAPGRLAPDGALALEIGWRQADDVVALLHSLEPGAAVSVARDLAGHDRMVVADRRVPPERGGGDVTAGNRG
jgi:release factor glutamine methyltransferase